MIEGNPFQFAVFSYPDRSKQKKSPHSMAMKGFSIYKFY